MLTTENFVKFAVTQLWTHSLVASLVPSAESTRLVSSMLTSITSRSALACTRLATQVKPIKRVGS